MRNSKEYDPSSLVEAVVKGIQEVKGRDICTIDLRKLNNAVTDYFIVCHGTSDTQVEAIARSVTREVFKRTAEEPMHKEGKDKSDWILLDYFDVVVHIFKEETRYFYNLEKLWADADVKEIEYQL
jgi:ribosome-associated protein